MRQSYDLFKGGLEQLEKDLIEWEKTLLQVNNLFVNDLANTTKEHIIANSSLASEPDSASDIASKNVIEPLGMLEPYKVGMLVYNTSNKLTFEEFGFGIVGQGTYNHDEFINQSSTKGWQGYNIDSPRKLPDRSWFYRDRQGTLHRSSGVQAKHILFYSNQETIMKVPSIFARYKGRLGLK